MRFFSFSHVQSFLKIVDMLVEYLLVKKVVTNVYTKDPVVLLTMFPYSEEFYRVAGDEKLTERFLSW